MSQHVLYASKVIRSREILIAALAALGLEAQVSDEGIPVTNMYGTDPRKCEVAVSREALAAAKCHGIYGAIGWYKQPDGTYAGWIDHLTTINTSDQPGMASREHIAKAVEQAYAKVAADKAVSTILTTTIPQWKAAGKVPANATVRRQKVGSATQIVLSYVTA